MSDPIEPEEEPPPIGWARAAVTALIIFVMMLVLVWLVYGFSPAE